MQHGKSKYGWVPYAGAILAVALAWGLDASRAQTSVTTIAFTLTGCGTMGSTVYNVNTFVPLTVNINGKVCEQ